MFEMIKQISEMLDVMFMYNFTFTTTQLAG